YRIDAPAAIVEVIGYATGEPGEFRLLFQRIRADPAYRAGFGVLRDRTGMPALSSTALREFAESFARIEGLTGTRFAIVAPDRVSFGTMRMFEALGQWRDTELALFPNVAQGREWLGSKGPNRAETEFEVVQGDGWRLLPTRSMPKPAS